MTVADAEKVVAFGFPGVGMSVELAPAFGAAIGALLMCEAQAEATEKVRESS